MIGALRAIRLCLQATIASRFRRQPAAVRWGEPGRELAIEIRPPWWETWWFRGLLVLVVLATIIGAYILRVRQIAQRFSIRLDERVNERTRIARELHDSLLQSFQGLIYRMQAVHALVAGSRSRGGDAARNRSGRWRPRDRGGPRSRATICARTCRSRAILPIPWPSSGRNSRTDGLRPLSFRVVVEGRRGQLHRSFGTMCTASLAKPCAMRLSIPRRGT